MKLIQLPENRGFTGACNAGLRAATGEIQILLNNDTEADSGWLEAVAATFERYPKAGSVASKMLLFDQRDVIHSAGDGYGIDGIPFNRGVWQKDKGQVDEPGWVFGGCGGAVASRRAMLEEVGAVDESVFMYCEDVDLNWRSQAAGWKCWYTPEAVVFHKLSATGGGPIASYYTGRNTLWVIAKNYPVRLLRKYWLQVAAAQWTITRDAIRAWRGEAARARLRGQLAGLLGWRSMHKKYQRDWKVPEDYIETLLRHTSKE